MVKYTRKYTKSFTEFLNENAYGSPFSIRNWDPTWESLKAICNIYKDIKSTSIPGSIRELNNQYVYVTVVNGKNAYAITKKQKSANGALSITKDQLIQNLKDSGKYEKYIEDVILDIDTALESINIDDELLPGEFIEFIILYTNKYVYASNIIKFSEDGSLKSKRSMPDDVFAKLNAYMEYDFIAKDEIEIDTKISELVILSKQLEDIQTKYGLKDTNSVKDYYFQFWRILLKDHIKKYSASSDIINVKEVATAWANSKSIKVPKSNENFIDKLQSYINTGLEKQQKDLYDSVFSIYKRAGFVCINILKEFIMDSIEIRKSIESIDFDKETSVVTIENILIEMLSNLNKRDKITLALIEDKSIKEYTIEYKELSSRIQDYSEKI